MADLSSASTPPTPPESLTRLHFGKLQHGCEHYKRRCKIRAPCCNQIFSCRHCHNDAMGSLSDPKDRHELIRSDVKQVICSICGTEQEAAKVCANCGVNMGEYYCEICKFMMMIQRKDSSIVTNAGFAGLVAVRISSTVRNVALAIR